MNKSHHLPRAHRDDLARGAQLRKPTLVLLALDDSLMDHVPSLCRLLLRQLPPLAQHAHVARHHERLVV